MSRDEHVECIETLAKLIRVYRERLKAEGFTIVLVEQNFRFASTVADRHYVMERGRIVEAFDNARLLHQFDRVVELLGV
jgi:branched-chain amino acid transport system ATP-binding protein